MSTYLVTGAAGFIAARVCELLLAQGHTVVGLDNLNDYYDVRLKEWRLARLRAQKGFVWRRGDLEDLPTLEGLFAAHKFDAVINLAARAGVRASLEQPELYRRTNVLGEEHVLQCQVKYGVRKHVLASSSSVYAGCPMPFREDAELKSAQSPYAGTKQQAEQLARRWHEEHGLDVSVLRYFTVFGPAGRPDMAPFRFVHWVATGHPVRLFGDGSQSRDFTYVDDIAHGTILAARPLGFDVLNLGGGNRPITLNAMIVLLETYLGRKAVIDRRKANPLDMTDTQADITKAGRLLGWTPRVSPAEGFRKTVDWYLANREWLKDIKL
ncbi:MAG: NAD-dependent epimerase/dehydratase family protein [Verrucomicrobiota bacterium]